MNHPLRIWLPDDGSVSASPEAEIKASFDACIAAKKLAPGTVSEYKTTERKLITWVRALRPSMPRGFWAFFRETPLSDFLAWVRENSTGENRSRSQNKASQNLHAVMAWLERKQPPCESWRAPLFPDKAPDSNAAQKVTLALEEVGRLYLAAGELRDPPAWPRSSCGPFNHQWQAAIVLMVTYGLDTGSVWLFGRSRSALRWSQVYWHPRPPSKRGDLPQDAPGWLVYKRQKVSENLRGDQTPMERPMSRQVAWQLRRLAANRPDFHRLDLVFRPPVGTHGQRPPEIFRRLCTQCAIHQGLDLRNGNPVTWDLKKLRKTCGTWHERTERGAAAAVLGHMPEGGSKVTSKHYLDPAPLAARAILATEYPPEFPV